MEDNDQYLMPELRGPLYTNVILGVQHVLAMFGATVLAPLLMGFDPNTCVFLSGIGTLIFFLVVKGQVPSYLGSSFAFIAVVIAATGYAGTGLNQNIGIALGGIIGAGLLYTFIGIIVHLYGINIIDKIFPKIVVGSVVTVIGVNLAKVAVQQIGADIVSILVGMVTLISVIIFAVTPKSFFSRIPILLGAMIGYALYFCLGNIAGVIQPINFAKFDSALVFGLPKFYQPIFDVNAISLIVPIAFVLVAENFGHVKAISGMINRDLTPHLGRTFIGDGIATMVSGAFGGTGVTTYAENMGVMKMTRNFSSITMVFAAFFAIILGFSPKFGALILTIPSPVLGGLSFVMFGLIAATGLSIVNQGCEVERVNLFDTRNLIIFGVPLIMSAGDFTVTIGQFSMGGIVTGTIMALFLYHLLFSKEKA
jgi:putative pyrimidine permease RutG